MSIDRRPADAQDPDRPTDRTLPAVAFVCTHNACRSQIAEALAKATVGDVLTAYSAGTEPAGHIDPHALHVLKAWHGIDAADQRPKSVDDLPPIDVVVTMGCGVQCPYLPCRRRIEWEITDPTGSDDDVYRSVIDDLQSRITALRDELIATSYHGPVNDEQH